MFTSVECRAMAEEKLAQAERVDHQHRRRLITAAEGWLFLASKLRDTEASFPTDKPLPQDARRKRRLRRSDSPTAIGTEANRDAVRRWYLPGQPL
jgi:hypothetical protein